MPAVNYEEVDFMKMTSAQAAKLLRRFNDELKALQVREANTNSFVAAIGEDIESVRPAYNFKEMRDAQADIARKIRKIKHAVNVFNTVTAVPDFDMTIDEMLVFIPLLTKKCEVLSRMKNALPKARENACYSRGSSIIEYRYANYDIEQAGEEYTAAFTMLSKAQTALDLVNNTVTFEVDIDI
jgi:hypothetical protein